MGNEFTDVATDDLALETSAGTVGLSALDGQAVLLWAGSYKHPPEARFGPLRVNRVAVDVIARFTRNEHGEWQPNKNHGVQVRRAGSFEDASRNAYWKVREALLAAVRGWADANAEVLAAAQYRAFCDQIANEQATLKQLYDQVVEHERQIVEITRQRDALTQRWTAHTG